MALVDAILQQACTRTPQQARARTTVARGHCNCGHAEGLPHGCLSQVLVAAEELNIPKVQAAVGRAQYGGGFELAFWCVFL